MLMNSLTYQITRVATYRKFRMYVTKSFTCWYIWWWWWWWWWSRLCVYINMRVNSPAHQVARAATVWFPAISSVYFHHCRHSSASPARGSAQSADRDTERANIVPKLKYKLTTTTSVEDMVSALDFIKRSGRRRPDWKEASKVSSAQRNPPTRWSRTQHWYTY